jgi:arylformamidase
LTPLFSKGVCLLGGLYNLEPLLITYVNDPIKMDRYVRVVFLVFRDHTKKHYGCYLFRECAERNSPMKIIQSRGLTMKCDVLVVIAERDSPAFHKQSEDFCNLLKEKLPHHSVEYLKVPEVDHFSLMEKCVEKDFILNKVLDLIVSFR